MKFNFKKITSVLASAIMLGSTLGIAAAANFPAPFVSGGMADVAVVVGANAASSDFLAAVDLGQNLQSELAKQTTTGTSTTGATASGGDSVKIEKSSDKLNIGNNLDDLKSTKIGASEMPNLLADGVYRSKDNIDYSYEQTIQISSATAKNWSLFADNRYKSKEPTLGISLAKSAKILNYTLDFTKDVRSDVVSGRLEDMENRDIVILGKAYKLLNAYNASSSTKFELMRGSASDTINLNEEKTEVIGDKTYTVTLTYVDATNTQFEVVDSEGTTQTTTKLAIGGVYKLSDGTQIGVTDLSYQALSGGVMNAEFTLGADKITIENGQVLEINDVDVNDINCYISRSEVSSTQADIQKIVLEWVTKDKEFVTAEQGLTLPGLESIKLEAGATTFLGEEVINIDVSGTYGIEMTIPIKDGDAKVDILYGNSSDFHFIGGDSDQQLRTGVNGSSNIVFDADTDDYFFASWNSTADSESYLLTAGTISEDTTANVNKTTISKVYWDADGTKQTEIIGKDKKAADIVTVGNVELTIDYIDYSGNYVNMTIGSGGTYSRVYTAGGLCIYLPYNNTNFGDGLAAHRGAFAETTTQPQIAWVLWMVEEDKDGNLGKGEFFNITLGHSSDKSAVTAVQSRLWSGGSMEKVLNTDTDYVGYIHSDLATEVEDHQTSGSQRTADVTYHVGQTYANVFLTGPDVTIASEGTGGTGITELGSVTVKDNEVSSVQGKNLVVVGGSCINAVAQKVLGSDSPLCSEDFTSTTGVGAGQFLIKVVDSPYTTGKVAMLVAGYDAADTTKAVKYVTTENPSTAVGTELKKVTSTYADVA